MDTISDITPLENTAQLSTDHTITLSCLDLVMLEITTVNLDPDLLTLLGRMDQPILVKFPAIQLHIPANTLTSQKLYLSIHATTEPPNFL